VNLPANVADAFTLTPAAAQAIASSGFNDASGLNSNPTANAPYNVNNVSINGQGAGESGWLAPWSFAATAPVVVNAGQFEGDGTLFLQGTSAAQRVLQLPMAGITSIQIILKIPSAATSGDGLNLYIRQQANRQVGPNWQASGDGHFRVVDDNEDGTGNLLDTGFLWTPGTYQAIRIDVNTVTRTWDFFVDGVKFNAPHPLGYRDAPTFLDEIDIGNFIGGPNGAFVDSVTVTRRDLVTIGSASAATVGGVTVVTLTGFSGPQTSAGSLQDGSYTLTALATQITTAGGQQLDGNGDGTPGDNYVLTDSGQPGGLFRFYGDINGDRFVNGADFALFRSAFGTSLGDPAYNAGFDLNGDGFVNGADFAAFRTNFGLSI
jgi:hypothetical protein